MSITFNQFKELEMVVARIKDLEDHPNADKLYVVTVEIKDATKKVVAGIKPHYTKEELVGKEVILLNNMEVATIRGVESHGMILATKDGEKLTLLIPEKEVSVGSRVS